MKNLLQQLLTQYKGTTIVAPIAVGVQGVNRRRKVSNFSSFDCDCGPDDCIDCYNCDCGSDDCRDCYDCHCGSDDCVSY